MKKLSFKFQGGPHDGDSVAFPSATIPQSKSMVLQDKRDPLGVLHKYWFSRETLTAMYQGEIRVKADALN